MPLLNIILPARAFQAFELMFRVVSFDYFPIHEIFDFGFTPTEPYTVNFGWLGYDSINFIEGMGSISLFLWIALLYILTVSVVYIIGYQIKKYQCL